MESDKNRLSRRNMMLSSASAIAGGTILFGRLVHAQQSTAPATPSSKATPAQAQPISPGQPGKDYIPVITPNGASLPWKLVDGTKVFHLIAGEFQHEFAPGLTATCWGY